MAFRSRSKSENYLHDRVVSALDLASKLLHPNPAELVYHGDKAGRFVVLLGQEAPLEVIELVSTVLRSESERKKGREGGAPVLKLDGDGVPAGGAVAVDGGSKQELL